MDFPDFQEFRRSLTEEQVQQICQINFVENIDVDIQSEGNINALVERLIEHTISHSVMVNLRILDAYHEWLRKHI